VSKTKRLSLLARSRLRLILAWSLAEAKRLENVALRQRRPLWAVWLQSTFRALRMLGRQCHHTAEKPRKSRRFFSAGTSCRTFALNYKRTMSMPALSEFAPNGLNIWWDIHCAKPKLRKKISRCSRARTNELSWLAAMTKIFPVGLHLTTKTAPCWASPCSKPPARRKATLPKPKFQYVAT